MMMYYCLSNNTNNQAGAGVDIKYGLLDVPLPPAKEVALTPESDQYAIKINLLYYDGILNHISPTDILLGCELATCIFVLYPVVVPTTLYEVLPCI